MTFRKLAAFSPLAVLVGATVHVAVAGFDHAPGGRTALDVAGWLVLGLALSLGAAFLAGAAGRARPSIATKGGAVYGSLALALAGTAAYAGLELLEGHFQIGGVLRALPVSFPIAALLLAFARRVADLAAVAGARFASARSRTRHDVPDRSDGTRHRTLVRRRIGAERRRGRAPPFFA